MTESLSDQQSGPVGSAPRLHRVLGLWDLIFYGIVLVMPIAPVPMFGVAQILSHGHFVTTILIAIFAMMLTAVSYGRMASQFPTAGSAYHHVTHPLAFATWLAHYTKLPKGSQISCFVYGFGWVSKCRRRSWVAFGSAWVSHIAQSRPAGSATVPSWSILASLN